MWFRINSYWFWIYYRITWRAGVAQSVHWLTKDMTTGVLSPASAKNFFFYSLWWDRLLAHPSSYPVVTRCPFPEVKHGRVVTLTTHPHLAPPPPPSSDPSPQSVITACTRNCFTFTEVHVSLPLSVHPPDWPPHMYLRASVNKLWLIGFHRA
jgi:hypothetical protein